MLINDIVCKFMVTAVVRLYSWLEPSKERKERNMSTPFVSRLCKAQMNVAEWSPMTMAALLYFHVSGVDSGIAPTIAVVGNIGYFWSRLLVGYPTISTAVVATVRYVGMLMVAAVMYSEAFGTGARMPW